MELRSAMRWLMIFALVITPMTVVFAQDATITEGNSIYKARYTEADKKALETRTETNDGVAPSNDNFANATQIFGGAVNVSNVQATAETGEPVHGAGRGARNPAENNSVWYKYVATLDGVLEVSTANDSSSTLSDTVLSAYAGTSVNALSPIAENDDFPGLSVRSRITFTVFAGNTYYIAADGFAADTGTFAITCSISAFAINNNFANAIDLSPFGSTDVIGITSSTFGATGETNEPDHLPNDNLLTSIWYKWTANRTGSITFSTHGSNYDTVLAVYSGSALGSLSLIGRNDDFSTGINSGSSQVTFFATQGQTYRIAIDGYHLATGNTSLKWNINRAENSKRFDFDGDLRTDISIFRPSNGQWWIERSGNASVFATTFGTSSDYPTPADFTGDGKVDIAFWRPSTGSWYVLRSEDSSFYAVPFGTLGDIPVVGHFDDDNKADNAVFRQSTGTWYVSVTTDDNPRIVQFGRAFDVPVAADYDGDGYTDIAIYRRSTGQWWINRSRAGVVVTTFGNLTDDPVVGDYTGDGRADVAVYRPSTGQWYVLRSEDNSYYSLPFGRDTDIAAPGDYDGDGRTDQAVFRPSSGTWYINRSFGGVLIKQFGISNDIPTPSSFIP